MKNIKTKRQIIHEACERIENNIFNNFEVHSCTALDNISGNYALSKKYTDLYTDNGPGTFWLDHLYGEVGEFDELSREEKANMRIMLLLMFLEATKGVK